MISNTMENNLKIAMREKSTYVNKYHYYSGIVFELKSFSMMSVIRRSSWQFTSVVVVLDRMSGM